MSSTGQSNMGSRVTPECGGVVEPVRPAGTQSPDGVALSQAVISASALVDELARGSGAVVTFEGRVRADLRGPDSTATIHALNYSAYEPMALEQMAAIRRQALETFGILDVRVMHRLGRLAIGEVSIAVAVAAAHRMAAFKACEWIVDQIKVDVPIWKKDVWSDGASAWHADGTPARA